MSENDMNIAIPDELYQQLQGRVQSSREFSSVDAYVQYVLEEVVKQMAKQMPTASTSSPYSKEQAADVKKRLEDLGYLD